MKRARQTKRDRHSGAADGGRIEELTRWITVQHRKEESRPFDEAGDGEQANDVESTHFRLFCPGAACE
jgi:hypothetical protein